MRRLDGLDSLGPAGLREPVAAVGVFDGVHRGHRQLLYELCNWATAVGGEPCVLTFDRHPLTVLRGVEVPWILSLEQRLTELERHGVAHTAVLDFGAIKDKTAEEFLREVLVERMGCRRLLLGFDSRIGKDRQGDAHTLPALGEAAGVEVRIASPVLDHKGEKVGSSAIRRALADGDLDRAANLLGRPVTVRAVVEKGAGRGRDLGAATANLPVAGLALPPDGVYLARAFLGAETAPAIANLGVRPTFRDGRGRTLEVHVPGWTGDLHGRALEVRLLRFVRPEQRFDDAGALKAQIEKDLAVWREAVARGEL